MTGDGGACGAVRPADPCALVIFGATGDLTRRKLLPALHSLARHGLVVPELPIVEPPRDVPIYAAGSWDPAAADRLLAREGRRWVPPA